MAAATFSIRATARSIMPRMKLTPDGQTLVVRGYLGIELLGKNKYWTRLPDSAYSMLDPAINPNTANQSRMRQSARRRPATVPAAAPAHRSELRGPLNTVRQ